MVSFSRYYIAYKNNIKSPADNLQSLLKVFSMFKIWYDESIVHEYVPNAVGVMCINFGKNIGW